MVMSFWKRLLGRGKKKDSDTAVRERPKSRRETKERVAAPKPESGAYPLANVTSLLKRAKADPDRAIADCTEALKHNPNDAAALCCRALARQVKQDGDGALQDAEAALEADSLQASTWTVRAILRLARNDTIGAAEDCSQAIELDPDYADAYAHRAIARERSGDVAGAKEDYAKSIDLQFRSSLSAEIRRDETT
jgi:tetratricopeptide (TPR) repeat protein